VKEKKRRSIKYKMPEEDVQIVKEPDAYYQTVHTLLGGKKAVAIPLHSEFDLLQLTRNGLKLSSVINVAQFLNITLDKMADILHISSRTVQRKKDSDVLSSYSSEQAIEVAEVIAKGLEVFQNREVFNTWMQSEIAALNYQKPLDLLDTSFGTKLILQVLGRIEHGVYS
jgi:putative toxin-antitoxin system antitoxin component (TIGR02293 family)